MSLKMTRLLAIFLTLQIHLIYISSASLIHSDAFELLDSLGNSKSSSSVSNVPTHSSNLKEKRVTFNPEKTVIEYENSYDFYDDYYADYPEEEPTVEEEARIDRMLFLKNLRQEILYDMYSLPWTKDDYLPAYWAAMNSHFQILKNMIDMNIPMNRLDMKTGETPIHVAYRKANPKIIKLIDKRIRGDIAPLSLTGMTPFHEAVLQGIEKIVTWILHKSNREIYKINHPNNDGVTPLMTAALTGNRRIFNMLINVINDDYLQKDNDGYSLIVHITLNNPVFMDFMACLEKDLQRDRNSLIEKISSDILFLLNNNTISKSKCRALKILKHLGISKNELIRQTK